MLKVKENPNLRRDPTSLGIINVDKDQMLKFKADRQKEIEFKQLSNEVFALKTDMNEIKSLLSQIASKLS